MALPDNSEESEPTIKRLINHSMIDNGLSKDVISKQDHVFETFEGIPENLWSYLLIEEKIVINWKNISAYLCCEDIDDAVVTELLGRDNIVDSLSGLTISIEYLGEDNSKLLSNFIRSNDEIEDAAYCKLIKLLPYRYHKFPEKISAEKVKCLAEEGKIILNEYSFSYTATDNQLVAILIRKNFNGYLKAKEKYPITDDVRELLLSSGMNDHNKGIVCQDITPQGAINNGQDQERAVQRLSASI